jgi:hypothetical protein
MKRYLRVEDEVEADASEADVGGAEEEVDEW